MESVVAAFKFSLELLLVVNVPALKSKTPPELKVLSVISSVPAAPSVIAPPKLRVPPVEVMEPEFS